MATVHFTMVTVGYLGYNLVTFDSNTIRYLDNLDFLHFL